MTVKGALKAEQAGAAAIVVSNHGGRVLDQCPATAEVLPEIAAALKGTGVKVLVDGGIRTGVDVFKALALGADGVLICRPFVTAVYGGGAEGVKCYIDKLAGELPTPCRCAVPIRWRRSPRIWCGSERSIISNKKGDALQGISFFVTSRCRPAPAGNTTASGRGRSCR